MDDTALARWITASLARLTETCGQVPWTDATSERTTAMSTTRFARDDELATATEGALTKIMLAARELPGVKSTDEDEDYLDVEVNVIETYREAGLLTSDKGLVVNLSDGRALHLTITAYGPAKS